MSNTNPGVKYRCVHRGVESMFIKVPEEYRESGEVINLDFMAISPVMHMNERERTLANNALDLYSDDVLHRVQWVLELSQAKFGLAESYLSKREMVRAEALAKLTDEEKEVLGLS